MVSYICLVHKDFITNIVACSNHCIIVLSGVFEKMRERMEEKLVKLLLGLKQRFHHGIDELVCKETCYSRRVRMMNTLITLVLFKGPIPWVGW